MNTGKALVLLLGFSAAAAGGAMYYLQVYAFYEELGPEQAQVQMTRLDGEVVNVAHTDFRAIDSDSSPIRYRACFTPDMSLPAMTETFVIYDEAVPLVAPDWFDCFDAQAVGEALETGGAIAFMGVENISYGIDRLVAVMPDGAAVSWHQINACGEVVFDGEAAPEGCPPVPERLQ